jgi:uncharacterized membrane protein
VATSEYAAILGIPVAYLGLGYALFVVACAAGWWLRADRRVLLAAYGSLLLATLFAACLTYLELFVIEAICPWCVGYALSVVVALVIAGVAMARTSRAADG